MRDGRRLFAGNEQRKGDGDFYDEDAAISMEDLNNRAKFVTTIVVLIFNLC
jgi:hypothetical protein